MDAHVRDIHRLLPGKTNDDRYLRQAAEALAITMLAPDETLRQAIREEGWRLLTVPDYSLARTCHPLAAVEGAYWRGVAGNLFPG